MNGSSRAIVRLGIALGIACHADLALAQATDGGASQTQAGTMEDVVVTARRVEERERDVPASVSVLSDAQLQAGGTRNLQDLITRVPNVAISGGIAGVVQGQVGIRGISTLVRNIGTESGVGFYVDGVYLGRPENYNQELIDVDRVEVLRGPQGTLFGKNTIAGVFNIVTKRPGDTPVMELRLETGNYDLVRAQAYVMTPLVADRLAVKISAGYLTRDGVYRHLSGGQNGDALDLGSYRAALYFTPDSATDIVLAYDGLRDRGHPAFFQVTDLAFDTPNAALQARTPNTIDNNRPDSLRRDNEGIALTAGRTLGMATLTSITAYRHSRYDAMLDDDQNQFDALSADDFGDRTRLFTQELRLASKAGDRLSYILGLYYANQRVRTDRILSLGSALGIPGNPSLTTIGGVNTRSYAAFGTVDYRLTDRLTASVGLRYTSERKSVAFTQSDLQGVFAFLGLPTISYADRVRDNDLSPTGSLTYKVADTVSVYGRVARGFKSAAFNVDLVGSTTGLAAGPENATSYEVGLKSDLFGRRARANFAVFQTDYDQLQVSQLLGSGVQLNNAGKARIRGFEAELAGYVIPALRLEGSLGYLDARYRRYANCGVPTSLGGGSTDCSGNRLIAAPELTGHAAAEFVQPVGFGSLVARVDYSGQSPIFFEATNSDRFKSDARHIVDARIGVRTDHVDLFAWVRNLTDTTYITYGDDRSAVGILRTTAYGEPRTYGATLSGHF